MLPPGDRNWPLNRIISIDVMSSKVSVASSVFVVVADVYIKNGIFPLLSAECWVLLFKLNGSFTCESHFPLVSDFL
jgi:hypothetical protein